MRRPGLPGVRQLACLAGLVGLLGCGEDPAGSANRPSIFEEGADQVMLEVEHYITRDGVRRGLLRADTAFTFEDDARVELRRLELQLYDDAGTDRGLLTALSGTYQLDSGDLTVRGGVELSGARERGEAASVLETDSLRYEAAVDSLRTGARYTLTRPDGTVETGRSLITDPALRNFRSEDVEVTTPEVAVPR
ncbi:MAG: LPS export ABC transporter periplasmic protein LptC [Gemmatimonadota bacterium]